MVGTGCDRPSLRERAPANSLCSFHTVHDYLLRGSVSINYLGVVAHSRSQTSPPENTPNRVYWLERRIYVGSQKLAWKSDTGTPGCMRFDWLLKNKVVAKIDLVDSLSRVLAYQNKVQTADSGAVWLLSVHE